MEQTINLMNSDDQEQPSTDSSVGRAEDCNSITILVSLGRWFESGSVDFFFSSARKPKIESRYLKHNPHKSKIPHTKLHNYLHFQGIEIF